MKANSLLDPKMAIPAVITAVIAVTFVGNRIQKRPVASGASAAAMPSPTTPDAVLAALPDAGTATAAAREIVKWRDAARKDGKNPAHWVKLGDGLVQRSRELGDPRYEDYAVRVYGQALTLDPRRIPALVGMAMAYGGRRQFDQSIEWAKKAIDVNPNDAAPYGLIGDAQAERGDYKGAFDSYQKMLDLRPDISSYSRGAHLLYLTGNRTKAIWLMEKAISAGSPYSENTAWCRAQLAEMLWGQGAVLPASIVLKEALKTAPNDYHVLLMEGRVKEALGNANGAIDAYNKAIAVSPQHDALVALGDLYQTQGRKAEAEAAYQKVETEDTRHPESAERDPLSMARFYADHDRNLDKALQIVEARKDLQSPVELDTAAWVYFKNGQIETARQWEAKALKGGAPDVERLYHAGMISARLGKVEQAQEFLYRAMSLNPHFDALQVQVAAATLKELGSHPAGSAPNPFAPKKTASR